MNILTPHFWQAFRFWSKVDFSGECWTWKGWGNKDSGYGRLYFRDGKDYAHRVAHRLNVRAIPAGLTVDHVKARGCVRRDCVRPSHLEAVTNAENIRRSERWQLKKTHCPRGHEYSPENTYYYPGSGGRQCKTCVRARSSRAYHGR